MVRAFGKNPVTVEPLPKLTRDLDHAAMRFDDALYDRQAKTRLPISPPSCGARAPEHPHGSALARELHGVRDEIEQDPTHDALIGEELKVRLDIEHKERRAHPRDLPQWTGGPSSPIETLLAPRPFRSGILREGADLWARAVDGLWRKARLNPL
jgi:hypothetical protein